MNELLGNLQSEVTRMRDNGIGTSGISDISTVASTPQHMPKQLLEASAMPRMAVVSPEHAVTPVSSLGDRSALSMHETSASTLQEASVQLQQQSQEHEREMEAVRAQSEASANLMVARQVASARSEMRREASGN